MTGFAQTLKMRTETPAAPKPEEVPFSRPFDPDAPPAHCADVVAPKGADAAYAKVTELRTTERHLRRELRQIGSAAEASGEQLKYGARLEAQLAQTAASADTAERALAASWVAAYAKARESLIPAGREAYEAAVAAREAAEAARWAFEHAEGVASNHAARTTRLTVEGGFWQRRLAELTKETNHG